MRLFDRAIFETKAKMDELSESGSRDKINNKVVIVIAKAKHERSARRCGKKDERNYLDSSLQLTDSSDCFVDRKIVGLI